MATTAPDATLNAACDAIADLADAGAGAGSLVLKTSGDVEVATLTLSDPAFGNAAAGVATADTITSDTSATGGVAAKGVIEDSDANEVITGAAGAGGSGAEFEISGGTTIGAGATVSCSSLTITVSGAA
jgi:hypothetical protein